MKFISRAIEYFLKFKLLLLFVNLNTVYTVSALAAQYSLDASFISICAGSCSGSQSSTSLPTETFTLREYAPAELLNSAPTVIYSRNAVETSRSNLVTSANDAALKFKVPGGFQEEINTARSYSETAEKNREAEAKKAADTLAIYDKILTAESLAISVVTHGFVSPGVNESNRASLTALHTDFIGTMRRLKQENEGLSIGELLVKFAVEPEQRVLFAFTVATDLSLPRLSYNIYDRFKSEFQRIEECQRPLSEVCQQQAFSTPWMDAWGSWVWGTAPTEYTQTDAVLDSLGAVVDVVALPESAALRVGGAAYKTVAKRLGAVSVSILENVKKLKTEFKAFGFTDEVAAVLPDVNEIKKVADTAVHAALDVLEPGSAASNAIFKKSAYRRNLSRFTGGDPGPAFDAHHIFPQSPQFAEKFEKLGVNIHDPRLLTWWEKSAHRSGAKAYNAEWAIFFGEFPNATREQVLLRGKEIADKFKLNTSF